MKHNPMRAHCRAIASGLVLCLAFGGLVAFSPLLHHWVEHGGRGAFHVHGKSSHARPHKPCGTQRKVFAHERPFDLPLPKIDLARLAHALSHAWSDFLAETGPGEDPAEHEHHSLPKLLATGLLDQEISFELTPPLLITTECKSRAPGNPVCVRFSVEPPGRAPPFRS